MLSVVVSLNTFYTLEKKRNVSTAYESVNFKVETLGNIDTFLKHTGIHATFALMEFFSVHKLS